MKFFLTLAFLLTIFPAWFFTGMEGGYWKYSTTLACIILLISSIRLSLIAQNDKPHILAITFYVFIYVWCGLAAIAQTFMWRYSWRVIHSPSDAEAALLLILIAIMAYEIGRIVSRSDVTLVVRVSTAADSKGLQPPLLSQQKLTALCIFAILSTVVCTYWIGGPQVLFLSRGENHEAVWKHVGSQMEYILVWTFLHSPAFVGFLLATYYCIKQWHLLSLSQRKVALVFFVLMATLNFAANYPPAQTRLWLGAITLSPLFVLMRWKPNTPLYWILGLVMICTVIFPNADIFKENRRVSDSVDKAYFGSSTVDHFLHKGDYDILQQTANGVIYADRFGYTYGENLLGSALFWVPRKIWPGKPYGTGVTVPKRLGYSFANLSAPLWIESYIAFGWPGAFLFFCVYGFFSGRLDTAYSNNVYGIYRLSPIVFLVPFGAAFQFFVLRGDLLNALAYPSLAILLIYYGSMRRRPPAILAHPTIDVKAPPSIHIA